MTDKEKTEEYVRALRLAGINIYNHLDIEKAYLEGLEAGRKELEKDAELKEISEMNSLSKVLIQRCKEVGIKDLYHLANYLTIIENQKYQIEKMKCCQNCKKWRNKPEPLAVHVSCTKCKDYSEWEAAE